MGSHPPSMAGRLPPLTRWAHPSGTTLAISRPQPLALPCPSGFAASSERWATEVSFSLLDLPPTPHGRTPHLRLSESATSSTEIASHLAFDGPSLIAVLPAAASLTATAVTTDGIAGQAPASGAALSWRPPDALLGLHAGWLDEGQTLLGTASGGAFGSLSGQAVFTGIEANAEFGPWRLGASAEIGSVSAQPRGGLVRKISPLVTSAFALHANRSVADGSAWRLSLSQPLRIESGHALLDVPTGRTKAGNVVRNVLSADLEPSGRQVDLALGWLRPLDSGVLRLGATLSLEPGHRRNAPAGMDSSLGLAAFSLSSLNAGVFAAMRTSRPSAAPTNALPAIGPRNGKCVPTRHFFRVCLRWQRSRPA